MFLARKEVGEPHFASHRRFRARIHGNLAAVDRSWPGLGRWRRSISGFGEHRLCVKYTNRFAAIRFRHTTPLEGDPALFAIVRGFEGCARGPSSLARTRWRVTFPCARGLCFRQSWRRKRTRQACVQRWRRWGAFGLRHKLCVGASARVL